jgi:hypothetical protein
MGEAEWEKQNKPVAWKAGTSGFHVQLRTAAKLRAFTSARQNYRAFSIHRLKQGVH